MSEFEFNPFGTSAIIVSFECDECGTHVESEEISVPSPDYSADTAHDSQTEEEGYAVCEKCEKQFEISIYVTYAGGCGHVEDLDDHYEIEVEEIDEGYDEDYYDAISNNIGFYNTFSQELKNLKKLSEANIFTNDLIDTLYRQIYIGVISTMETYLSDAFINTTLKSKEFTENFVTTFADFKDKKIGYTTLFDEYNKLEDTCKKAMLEVIYHNLGKIKGMYKATLNVDLGDIANVSKYVAIRHDLVHRNGKTKEGAQHTINRQVIEELISDVEQFIRNIDNKIKNIN